MAQRTLLLIHRVHLKYLKHIPKKQRAIGKQYEYDCQKTRYFDSSLISNLQSHFLFEKLTAVTKKEQKFAILFQF